MSSLLINFLVFWFLGARLNRLGIKPEIWRRLLRIISGLFLAYLTFSGLAYLVTPLFFDHGESTMASIAANWMHGGAMYTALDSADQYTLLYGPWPVMLVALSLSLGTASIFLAKLPGVLSLMGSLGGFYWLLTRTTRLTHKERVFTVGLLAITLCGFYNVSYFIRPDSALLLIMVLGLLLVELVPQRACVYLGLGILAALSFNSKVNAPLYIVPLAFLYLDGDRKHRWSLSWFFAATALSLLTAAAPFFLPGISAQAFHDWIMLPWVSQDQSWPLVRTLKGLTFGAPFLIVLAVLGAHRVRPMGYWSLAVISVITGLLSGTPGSSLHMYLPLFPIYIWLAAKAYDTQSPALKSKHAIACAALILSAGLQGINKQKRMVELFGQTPFRLKEFADFKKLVAEADGPVEMGYAAHSQYESSFYKPWLVHHGMGLFLDACALMKITYSGVPIPAATIEKAKSCQVPYFIIPRGGEPWTTENFYHYKPLFSPEFKAAFQENYELEKSSEFFDLYRCNRGRVK